MDTYLRALSLVPTLFTPLGSRKQPKYENLHNIFFFIRKGNSKINKRIFFYIKKPIYSFIKERHREKSTCRRFHLVLFMGSTYTELSC